MVKIENRAVVTYNHLKTAETLFSKLLYNFIFLFAVFFAKPKLEIHN
ncbi:hypothetical protein OTUT144_1211 [Orientia tsutsugamushi str. UT144]|uniref:Uncharacterized protein n=1 Tax=Orientia tsutsugamushi str. UT144 TaxID=1441384 RepID=A0A0F3RK39_ORITS|nr:hypothetical protein OTUT144_1211 [Orientia tsutsugamushi str. UT144]